MSSALTDFQKLLKKTQKEMLLKPKETVEKTGKPVDKSNFLKFQQLPSVIKLPQTSSGSSGLKAAGSAPSKSLGPPASGSNHLGNNIKRTADTTARNNNTQASNTPKPKSFKELMKMAKAVKPEGLVRIEKPAEIPRERIRQPIDGNGVRQVMPSQQQKYRVVEPIHKMVQPKSKVYSPQTSKRGKKYVPSDLIKLNTNKRDLASTEEIQDELLRKRGVVKQPVFKDSRTMTATSKSSLDSLSRPKVAVANRDRGREISASRLEPHARSSSGSRLKPNTRPPSSIRRERSAERYESQDNNYSSVIQDIFGRGLKRPAYDDYSDDSSDMEANFNDIYREEQRSLKIGKKEDELNEMELKAKAEAKMKKYR